MGPFTYRIWLAAGTLGLSSSRSPEPQSGEALRETLLMQSLTDAYLASVSHSIYYFMVLFARVRRLDAQALMDLQCDTTVIHRVHALLRKRDLGTIMSRGFAAMYGELARFHR